MHKTKEGYLRGAGRKMVHVAIAEAALGRPMPKGAKVHHVDEDKMNNAPDNLVICPSDAYHFLLHQRMRARDACGNPNWRKCCRCGQYDAPENVSVSGSHAFHAECNRQHASKQRARRRALSTTTKESK